MRRTPEIDADVVRRYNEGDLVAAIKAECRVSTGTLYRILHGHRVKLRRLIASQIRVLIEGYDLLDWVRERGTPRDVAAVEFTLGKILENYGLPKESSRGDLGV